MFECSNIDLSKFFFSTVKNVVFSVLVFWILMGPFFEEVLEKTKKVSDEFLFSLFLGTLERSKIELKRVWDW